MTFKDWYWLEWYHTSVASSTISRRVTIRSEPSSLMANYIKIKGVKSARRCITITVEENWTLEEWEDIGNIGRRIMLGNHSEVITLKLVDSPCKGTSRVMLSKFWGSKSISGLLTNCVSHFYHSLTSPVYVMRYDAFYLLLGLLWVLIHVHMTTHAIVWCSIYTSNVS